MVTVTETKKHADDRLRLTRLARGLSQGDLATAAGVTRQAISGIESGRWSPSLDVALALAQVLDSSVEELFGTPPEPPPVRSRLAVAPAADVEIEGRSRMLLADVAGDTVAFPLVGDHTMVTGFVPALATAPLVHQDGESSPRSRRAGRSQSVEARRLATPSPTLAIAGGDPALALLLGPLQRHDPPVDLAWWATVSTTALEMLEAGVVHVAAVHRSVGETPAQRPGIDIVGFARWRAGLAVAPHYRGVVNDLSDVVSRGLRIANRPVGGEARRLLDAELARLGIDPSEVLGYGTDANGHLLAASAIAGGLVQASVVCEPAAIAYGLHFIPWEEEICELHIPRALLASIEVRALLDVLAGRELPAQLEALEGYDANPCGRILAA